MVAAADFRHDDRTPTPLCLSLSPPPTKSWHSFSLLETDYESQCPSSLEGPEGGQRHTRAPSGPHKEKEVGEKTATLLSLLGGSLSVSLMCVCLSLIRLQADR